MSDAIVHYPPVLDAADVAAVIAHTEQPLVRAESTSCISSISHLSRDTPKAASERDLKGHRRTPSGDRLAKLKPPFKKNLSDAPISKELSERARSAPLVKKFALPASETLINDYSAALLKHILIHGRLYVSQNYMCFESKIFGIKTMEVIPFKDITILTKKSKKLKFAHGIEVATSSQTYYFASFVSRVRAFETLTKVWRQHVPKGDTNSDEDDSDTDDDSTTTGTHQDYESDDSALKLRKDKKTSKEHPDSLKLGRSVEVTAEQLDDKEKGLRRFSSPLLSRVLPNGKSTLSSASTTDLHGGAETAPCSPITSPNNGSPPSSAPINIPGETPAASPQESEDEEEGLYDEGDGFLGAEAPMQQILTVNFPVNVKTFFKLFFSDESTFSKLYHDARGDKDLVVKQWSNSPQFGLIRDVLFKSPVKVPLGPSHTRITETQRYHLTKNRLQMDTLSMMLDIPYGDCFRIEGKWDVNLLSPNSCKLVVNIGVHFMKKTWFKSKIETQTIKETKESFQQWASLAPAEIAKYKATLPDPNNPPSQPPSAATSPNFPPRHDNKNNNNNNNNNNNKNNNNAVQAAGLSSPPQPASYSTSTTVSSTTSVSFEPTIPLEGSRRKSVSGEGGKLAMINRVFSSISSISNIFEGQSIGSILLFIVVGFIFINMYLRIVYLEGKVSTLETILQPLLTKEL